jgi:hypothetical protein
VRFEQYAELTPFQKHVFGLLCSGQKRRGKARMRQTIGGGKVSSSREPDIRVGIDGTGPHAYNRIEEARIDNGPIYLERFG